MVELEELCDRCKELGLKQPERATYFPNQAGLPKLCTVHFRETTRHVEDDGDDMCEIVVPLTASQLSLVHRAASLSGVTVAQFTLDAALLRARMISGNRSSHWGRDVESVIPL